jgi:hypothetical protein
LEVSEVKEEEEEGEAMVMEEQAEVEEQQVEEQAEVEASTLVHYFNPTLVVSVIYLKVEEEVLVELMMEVMVIMTIKKTTEPLKLHLRHQLMTKKGAFKRH